MCQALQELMKDDIEEKLMEQKTNYSQTMFAIFMKSLNFSAEQAMDVLQIPQNRRAFILSNL